MGFDIHPFVPGRKLILGGVAIPHKEGLSGHSDADVVIHALCDALLGALGQGDIGEHFPDTDSKYKDISSLLLLQSVLDLKVISRGLSGSPTSRIDSLGIPKPATTSGHTRTYSTKFPRVLVRYLSSL